MHVLCFFSRKVCRENYIKSLASQLSCEVWLQLWPSIRQSRSEPRTWSMAPQNGVESLSIAEAISQMALAVQNGDFSRAEALGEVAPVPLSIPKASLRPVRPISEGAQATVSEAEMELSGTSRPVAVKRARIREAQDLVRFRDEVELLAAAQHPHVVELVGARLLPPDYLLIMGLCSSNAAHEMHTAGWRPGWPGALALGAQLASALAHIHAAGILHRDLKPPNLLLSKDRRSIRLTDFGIAVRMKDLEERQSGSFSSRFGHKPTGGFHKAAMLGTLEYMAPEVLLKKPYTAEADVFALGVVINELASAQVPYSDCTRDNPLAHTILEMGYGRQELAAAVAAEGLRPTIAPGAPPGVARLLRQCWDAVPERRAAAAVVAAKLAKLAAMNPWHDDGSSVKKSASGRQEGSGRPSMPHSFSALSLPALAGSLPEWTTALLGAAPRSRPLPIGSFATAGARGEDKMEDRCIVVRDVCGVEGCTLAAVFDGHRGVEASEYLASNIEWHLEDRWADSRGPSDLLRAALLDADRAFRRLEDEAWAGSARAAEGAPRRSFPGSTATVALLVGRRLAVANLGDSRAVLCRGGRAISLTQDQTAEREDERARVQAAGGQVGVRSGGWRVGGAGLAVTRSVGDADLKAQGVTAEAEVCETDVGPEDAFLVLATDGVWEKVSCSDAVDLVHDTVKQPAMCAQRIVTEALARGTQDNVTAIVAILEGGQEESLAERIFHEGKGKYGSSAAAKRVAARVVEDESRDVY